MELPLSINCYDCDQHKRDVLSFMLISKKYIWRKSVAVEMIGISSNYSCLSEFLTAVSRADFLYFRILVL